jgi:hypothetical protein
MADATDTPTFDQWCVVELFGHQRYAGRIRQADWPPGFARLEIPATPGHDAVTQLLSPQSIYRLTPTTEAIATAVAAQCRPEPVHRWELPAAPVELHVPDLDVTRDRDMYEGDDEPF